MKYVKKIILIAVVGIVFFVGFNMILNKMYSKEQLRADVNDKISLGDGLINLEKIANATEVNRAVDSEIFVLIAGVDQRPSESEDTSRTDTLMLLKADFNKGSVDIISLPRDSRVKVKGNYTKLNHAHSLGGINLTIKTIRDWLHVDLDYYVEVNFQAVKDIVNAMGGIEYDIPEGINFEYEGVTVHEGKQVLDGDHALAYLRHRHSYKLGDIGRIDAQQKFLKFVLSKALSNGQILNFPKYVQAYFKDVTTNIPFNQLVDLAFSAKKIKPDLINTYTIPGEGKYIGQVSYYVVDNEKTKELVDSLLKNYKLLIKDEKEYNESSEVSESDNR